ncbi:MAG: phosphotransferase [Rubripirellula sp.]|nr:phosphotransferase [Rubripirellula sp.]
MIDPDIPPSVMQEVVAAREIVAIKKLDAGFSGGIVVHCRSASGDEYALKRWPSSIPIDRIETIHRVIIHAFENGCDIIARPLDINPGVRDIASVSTGTVHSSASGNWELSQWRPGIAATVNAGLDTVYRGAQAIAHFHACTASLESRLQPAPIIRERLQILESRHQLMPVPLRLISQWELDPDLTAALRDAANLIQWKWDEAQDQIHRSLTQYGNCSVPNQYVLRDVHAQHVLFSADQVTGLIDFDAVRIDTPASDLARWAGSFLAGNQPTSEVWEAAVAGYRSRGALTSNSDSDFEVRLAMDLCFAGTWISLANWLVWLLIEQRSFRAPASVLAERIRNLIRIASPEHWHPR